MKSIKKKKKNIKIYVVLVIIVIVIGVGLFFWSQGSILGNAKPSTDTSKQTQKDAEKESTEPQNSGTSPTESENDDTPKQYEGQTEEDSNPNCIDAECSNFKIPEGE